MLEYARTFEAEGWRLEDFVGGREALRYAGRELAHVARVLEHTTGRRVAVQAGGNLGVFPKYLAKRFEAVYTFEPAPDCFAALMHNAPEENVFKFQAALGDVRALVGLSRVRRDGKPNAHEGITHVAGFGRVPTLRVDDLGLEVCDLLYLDIEGGELEALKGAEITITRSRPVLAVEINKNARFVGVPREAIVAFLARLGYGPVEKLGSDEVFLPC